MSVKYATHFSTRQTPQSEPIPGKPMVENSAGGFGFQLDDWKRLDRFLILGCEGGTYYARERDLTIENAGCVQRCVAADGIRTVNQIVAISDGGRAPKNDASIFAMAICAGMGSPETKAHALAEMPKVCRIGTHLFQFVEAVKAFRGWGPGLRKAVAKWYDREDAAFQCVKYQQRDGVSHRDVLRLCHRKNDNSPLSRWIIKAELGARTVSKVNKSKTFEYGAATGELPPIVQAFEEAKRAESAAQIVRLIETANLPRECIPTNWLNDCSVWDALLQKMPLTALVRNLGKMTSIELIKPLSKAAGLVLSKLGDRDYIHKSRLHPISILVALRTYAQGRGEKGSLTWSAVPQVIDALDAAFYAAFDNVEPTGTGWMLGIDVSGSMTSPIAGMPLSCCEAATALALVTAHTEPNYVICAFDSGLKQLPISKGTRLDDALRHTRNINGGGTDCSLPMVAAAQQNLHVQNFVVLTDCETWAGNIHPCQALQQYRQKSGIPAKLTVAAMTATGFTIADPSDFGMMDVVGFDTSTPQVMAEFAKS